MLLNLRGCQNTFVRLDSLSPSTQVSLSADVDIRLSQILCSTGYFRNAFSLSSTSSLLQPKPTSSPLLPNSPNLPTSLDRPPVPLPSSISCHPLSSSTALLPQTKHCRPARLLFTIASCVPSSGSFLDHSTYKMESLRLPSSESQPLHSLAENLRPSLSICPGRHPLSIA